MVLCPYVWIILCSVSRTIFLSLEIRESKTIHHYLLIWSDIWSLCTIICLLYHQLLTGRIFLMNLYIISTWVLWKKRLINRHLKADRLSVPIPQEFRIFNWKTGWEENQIPSLNMKKPFSHKLYLRLSISFTCWNIYPLPLPCARHLAWCS